MKLVVIIIVVIFYIVRAVINSGKDEAKTPPKKRPKVAPQQTKGKSIDDIFDEFVKQVETIENKKTQQQKPVQKPIVSQKKKSSQQLDWQKVDHTHIKSKQQLLDHNDYKNVSHRIDKAHQNKANTIAESEGEVYELDSSNIDWKQAIITKEILERKYS